MRPLTKVILVLSLVMLAVVVLYVASRKWSGTGDQPPGPSVADRSGNQTPGYSDPVAMYQRWRDRLKGQGDQTPPEGGRNAGRDLASTSRDEGTVVARRQETPVAGADPPGPVLRPEGVLGEIFSGRLRSPARGAVDTGNVHVVVQGDTLYGIAIQHYGDARHTQAIEAANPGLTPNRLRVGERIVLPDMKKPEEKLPSPTGPSAPQTKVYAVQRNDTLIGIARRVYGDAAMYPRIYEANKDILSSPNARLYVGMRLRLPEPK